jgi:hypothetical protein
MRLTTDHAKASAAQDFDCTLLLHAGASPRQREQMRQMTKAEMRLYKD